MNDEWFIRLLVSKSNMEIHYMERATTEKRFYTLETDCIKIDPCYQKFVEEYVGQFRHFYYLTGELDKITKDGWGNTRIEEDQTPPYIIQVLIENIKPDKLNKWARRALGAISPPMRRFNRELMNWYRQQKVV